MAFEHYDKCSLLLPMDGDNNGTTFTDWSLNNASLVRGGSTLPVTSTSQSKYYGSSCFFAANASGVIGSHLRLPAINIGTGPFTVAAWCYKTDDTDFFSILDLRTNSDYDAVSNSDNTFVFLLRGVDTKKLRFSYGASNTPVDCTTTFTTNTWHHCAVTRDYSDTLRVFFNGVLEATVASHTNDYSGSYPVIGSITANSIAHPNRYMNDFILVTDKALWTDTFTPPTRLIGEISGTIKDATDSPAARIVTAFPRTNPTRAFSTVSSDVDGTYSLRVPVIEVSRIALADEATLYNDIADRIIPE